MEEAAELSHRIAIMDQGRLVACGTHAELIRLIGEVDRLSLTLSGEPNALLGEWRRSDGVQRVAQEDGHVEVLAEDSNLVLPRLFDMATHGRYPRAQPGGSVSAPHGPGAARLKRDKGDGRESHRHRA
jgi:ABC-2 type transport system ATP-binding protein